MITEFKIFENESENLRYWLVPTDSRFESSIRQVCDDERWISTLINNRRIFHDIEGYPKLHSDIERNNSDYIFISQNSETDSWNQWGWNTFENESIINDYYESNGYKFSGYLGLTPEEINILEFKNKIKNYNL